jgi:hypothetical protein
MDYGQELANLGYPGYAHHKDGDSQYSPTQFLLLALAENDLDRRVAEGLPWVVLANYKLDWKSVYEQAQLKGIQNRLGFTLLLARDRAVLLQKAEIAAHLSSVLECTVPSDKEDTFANDMTKAERRWLRVHRSKQAAAWNLLSDYSAEDLEHCCLDKPFGETLKDKDKLPEQKGSGEK